MPISYATQVNLNKNKLDSSDDFFFMDILDWYDNQHHINLKDYKNVNTLDYLNLVDKNEKIISIIITNEKEIDLNQISNLTNLQHLKIESVENITFCDLNTSLKHLEVTYCALNYPPVVPEGLIILDISMNLISSLDVVKLPESVQILNLNDNHFNKFPSLPNNIKILYICSNYLKEVGDLPKNLTHLYIKNNYIKLESLPNLEGIFTDICLNNNILIES